MPKTKEKGTRQPELQEIIDSLEAYREALYKDLYTSPTKYNHMEIALHNAKNIIRQLYGAKQKKDIAWIK